jgi:hypothetical protein
MTDPIRSTTLARSRTRADNPDEAAKPRRST